MSAGGTVTKTVLIVVKNQGLDQANTAIKGLASSSTTAAKSTNALGQSFNQTQTGALRLNTNVTKLQASEMKTAQATTQYGKAADNAGKSTSGLAAKFQGNKGAIFAFVGMGTAGMEAIGMFGMYQNAAAKVSDAQARLTQLELAGAKGTKEYKDAQKDLTDANRGLSFAFRILALSVGDMIPFTLLIINSIVKMRDTLGGAKGAIDATSAATTALGNASKGAATAGLTPLATSAAQTGTGLTNLSRSAQSGAMAMDTMYTSSGKTVTGLTTMGKTVTDNTKFIGTKGSGLVGGISALSLGMDASTKTSTKFKDAFRQIGESVKSIPGIFKGIGSSIAGFFTNFSGNMSKFGGILKTAGAAAMTFSKTMLMAFLSNPITAAIALISGAVLALATDFGGIRTAVNNAGVAIGNAVPALKGLLQGFGDAANGALDYVAGLLGVDTQSQKTAKAVAATKLALDPTIIALNKFLDIGSQAQKLDAVVNVITSVRENINNLGTTTDASGKVIVTTVGNVANSFETAMGTVKNKSQEVNDAIAEFHGTIRLLENSTLSNTQKQDLLNAALTKVYNAISKDVTATEQNVKAKQQLEQSTTKTQAATLGLSEGALKVAIAMNKAQASEEGVKEATDKNAEAVQNLITKYGGVIPPVNQLSEAQTKFLNLMYDAAPLLEDYESNLQLVNGTSIDWQKTILDLTAQHQRFTDQSTDDWEAITALLDQGVVGYKNAISYVELLGAVDKERGALAQKNLEAEIAKREENSKSLSDMIDKALEGSDTVAKGEEKQQKALETSRQKIIQKAKELQIYDDIQKLSAKDQEAAIKITENEQKAMDTSRQKLQQMAVQRGLHLSAIGQESGALLKHIETHKLAGATIDDVNLKIAEMITTREEDTKTAEIEAQANEYLLEQMNKIPPVAGMSAKGLGQLVKIYEDTANATEIAADEVGTWWAELEKSQKVEEATKKQLLDFAKVHGVDIPDSIKNGSVEGIKEFIEQTKGMGPAAKKAAEEVKKSFEDLRSKGASALDGIISDKLGEDGDEIKKALKGLKKLDIDMNSFTAAERIIDIYLNDESFTNDLKSLSDTMLEEFGRMEDFSHDAGVQIGDKFVGDMTAQIQSKSPATANAINAMWERIKASAAPTDTGDTLLGKLNAALNNPTLLKQTMDELSAAAISGAQTGLSPLPITFQESLDAAVNGMNGRQDNFYGVGEEMAGGLYQGAADGSGRLLPKVSNDMLKMMLPDPSKAKSDAAKSGKAVPEGMAEAADGSGRILNQTSNNMLQNLLAAPFKEDAAKKGGEVPQGVADGMAAKKSVVQSATLANVVDPITGEVTKVPVLVEKEITPVEGVFNTAFLKASTAATGQLNSLFASVYDGMQNLLTNTQTQLGAIESAWLDHATKIGTPIENMKTQILTVQQTFSNLSSNVLTYTTSMGGNILTFQQNAITNLTLLNDYLFNTLQLTFSNLSISVATYMTSMTTNIQAFIDTITESFGAFTEVIVSVHQAFSTMSTSIATYAKSMTTNVKKFTDDTTKNLGALDQATTKSHKAFSTMSTSVATYMKSMTTNIANMAKSATTSFGTAGKAATALQKSESDLSKNTATYTKSMAGNLSSFSKSAVSSLNAVAKAAKAAEQALKSMAQAAAKAKAARSGLRFGGAFVTGGSTMNQSSFAQQGKSFINSRPRKIGGVNISEFSKPELVTVTPLSNPNDPMDKGIGMFEDLMTPKVQKIPNAAQIGSGSGSRGGGGPTIVKGDLYVTVKTQSGKVLAQEIKPFMLDGFSGIT